MDKDLKKNLTELRDSLNEVFDGNITVEDTENLVDAYVEQDQSGLYTLTGAEDELPSMTPLKNAVTGVLLQSYERKKTRNEKKDERLEAWLRHFPQALEHYYRSAGAGTERFKAYAENVRAEDTLVIGQSQPCAVLDLAKKNAKKRLALDPNGNKWSYYTFQSFHIRPGKKTARQKPLAKHDGLVNAVRITLGETKTKDVKTPIGWVRKRDHFIFSHKDVRKANYTALYINGKDKTPVKPKDFPAFKRLDLVTPARHKGNRFAPLAVYIAYAEEDAKKPLFYIMESGNVLGEHKVLYYSEGLEHPILTKTGYKPSPFSSPDHYYRSKVDFEGIEPVQITIEVYTEKELTTSASPHFNINLAIQRSTVEQVADYEHFLHPFHQTFAAFKRILQLQARGVK